MNFPSGAPEFLDVFKGLYSKWKGESQPKMPIVHCYCFIKGELEIDSARERVRSALFDDPDHGATILKDEDIDVRIVRDVAPKKVKVCATFRVPEAVAYDICNEPEQKKLKIGEKQGNCSTS